MRDFQEKGNPDCEVEGKGDSQGQGEVDAGAGFREGDSNCCGSRDVGGATHHGAEDGRSSRVHPDHGGCDGGDAAVDGGEEATGDNQSPAGGLEVANPAGGNHSEFEQEEAEHSLERSDEEGRHGGDFFCSTGPTDGETAHHQEDALASDDLMESGFKSTRFALAGEEEANDDAGDFQNGDEGGEVATGRHAGDFDRFQGRDKGDRRDGPIVRGTSSGVDLVQSTELIQEEKG